MSEKEMKSLNEEEIEKVSGGKIATNYYYDSKGKVYITTQSLSCDKCNARTNIYPVNGGHLCEKCLKEYKKITGK